MLGRSLALEVSKPDLLGEDRSSGAPGDTDAPPARSLTVFSSHKLMNIQVRGPAALELWSSNWACTHVRTLTRWLPGLISPGCSGKGEGLAG